MKILKKIKDYNHFQKIISLNKNIFKTKQNKTNKEILIEFNNFCADHIPLSFCSDFLKNKYKAKIVAYSGQVLLSYPLKQTLFKKIKFYLGNLLNLNFFGVYKSFGVEKFIYPSTNKKILDKANKSFKYFDKKIKNLENLEDFTLKKVLLGDLIYDTFLKNQSSIEPTIDIHSDNFKKFVYDFLVLFEYWYDYLKTNQVKAIISSHSVYVMGMLTRIGKIFKIDGFILTHDQLNRVNKNHPRELREQKFYRKIFKNLDKKKKSKLIQLSKKKIKNRLDGIYSSDYFWITKSPFGKGSKINIEKKNKKIFVIATHDFLDAPHTSGKSLFPDFYLWFLFLCEFSKKTDHIWLIKNHPDFGGKWSRYMKYEREVIERVIKNYKHIKVLHKNTTLNDLVETKVDAIFTVNGSIGLDGALLNIPVINASNNNPHINYNFNIHPKNIKELKDIILNFEKYKKKLKINKDEIYEFYGMRSVFFTRNWFFSNLEKISKEIDNHYNLHDPIFYDYWIKNYKKFDETKIKEKLKKYFDSKNVFLLENNNLGNF